MKGKKHKTPRILYSTYIQKELQVVFPYHTPLRRASISTRVYDKLYTSYTKHVL